VSIEDLAALLFELVSKRFSNKEVVSKLIDISTNIITVFSKRKPWGFNPCG